MQDSLVPRTALIRLMPLIAEGRARTVDDIRELMSGNICRCGAYPNIVAAITQAMGVAGGKP